MEFFILRHPNAHCSQLKDHTLIALAKFKWRAVAAATRVLCYWRDRVPDALALLKVQATDDQPRVRLEAVRACSFFKTGQAAEVALAALDQERDPNHPDYYIKYCLDETMKALDKYVK